MLTGVLSALLLPSMLPSETIAAVGASSMKKEANPYSAAVGYEAAESAFSPMQSLYAVPTLPQSALLNSLPIDNELVGQLQAFLESFVQLINPTPRQIAQIERNNSALWSNLRINAQRATGMFLYNQKLLLPPLIASEGASEQQLRKEYGEKYLKEMKFHLLRLVNASRATDVDFCLICMQRALNRLNDIAYLQVPLTKLDFDSGRVGRGSYPGNIYSSKNLQSGVVATSRSGIGYGGNVQEKLLQLPRLLGRATVKITFRRPKLPSLPSLAPLVVIDEFNEFGTAAQPNGYVLLREPKGLADGLTSQSSIDSSSSGIGSSSSNIGTTEDIQSSVGRRVTSVRSFSKVDIQVTPTADITMVVDGINHPYTAGNFIDLCLKGYYENLKVGAESIDFGGEQVANFTILGQDKDGFIEPSTGQQRRIPLEIYREDATRVRSTTIGSARNSAVFTKARPVQSFATLGAIGMFHPRDFPSDASSSIFWLPLARSTAGVSVNSLNMLPLVQRLNSKFSLFAYVVDGGELLRQLRPGDTITSVRVEEGIWQLVQPQD